MSIEFYVGLARGGAIKQAEEFFLRGNKAEFKKLWDLIKRASSNLARQHHQIDEEIDRCIDALKVLADDANLEPGNDRRGIANPTGMNLYQTADVAGKYVVFSDVHITARDNRQGFFHNTGNKGLYLQVLESHYATEEFTLIENGDIEELLIYEPIMDEIRDIKKMSQDDIDALRERKKQETLRDIARDHPDYYALVDRLFTQAGRYIRLVGNHDADLSSREYVDIIADETGIDWPLASDVAILSDGNRARFLICHGHQFDHSCTPKFANQIGENFSHGSAWAYQGPDRFWTSANDGQQFMDRWLNGTLPYENMLSIDTIKHDTLNDQIWAVLKSQLRFIGVNLPIEGWEALYGKNIAWQYFANQNDPEAALDEEVKPGIRWIKFRHLNEEKIVQGLDRLFGMNSGPKLVLGHSHEPRFRSGMSTGLGQTPRQATTYLNSAAAGRFENLIWGIEIEGGEEKLISWHRDLNTGLPVRTSWIDQVNSTTGQVTLQPASTVSMPDETRNSNEAAWLAATFPLTH